MHQNAWEGIDLLKMDIEGSEIKIFERGYEDWLPFTKTLIIELHETIMPGCSTVVFKALENYNFTKSAKGENLIFTNNDLN